MIYYHHILSLIAKVTSRELRHHYIHAPLVKRVYSECSPLLQLIKVINTLNHDENDDLLTCKKSTKNTHKKNNKTTTHNAKQLLTFPLH